LAAKEGEVVAVNRGLPSAPRSRATVRRCRQRLGTLKSFEAAARY